MPIKYKTYIEKELAKNKCFLNYILKNVCETEPDNLTCIEVKGERLRLKAGGWYEYTVTIRPTTKNL